MSSRLNLGQLISDLVRAPQGVHIQFEDQRSPLGLESYRGFFSDLAIIPGLGFVTVRQFLTDLRRAPDRTYEGYDKGHYIMSLESRVWVSQHGQSDSRTITGLRVVPDLALVKLGGKMVEIQTQVFHQATPRLTTSKSVK